MYEELVKRLKIAADWAGKGFCITPSLCLEAANAIEELEKVLNAVNNAHNEGYDVGYWAGRRDYECKWIPVTEENDGEV